LPATPARPTRTGRWSRLQSRNSRLLVVLAALLALAGCETRPPPDRLTLAPAGFADLPGWTGDQHSAALAALRRSCERLARLPDTAALGVAGTAADWREPCAAIAAVPPGDDGTARATLERWFVPFAAGNNGNPQGLFTGYYEPELRGARMRGGRYTVPLYGRPADLVTVDLGQFRDELKGQRIVGRVRQGALRRYATRAEIEAGALQGVRHEDGGPLELVWVDDGIDAFFLQIQGSGRIVFEDGSVLRVGYAERNGHPYVAIGRELVARGVMTREQVSMQSIRTWLAAHPGEAAEVMNRNPSFVFFRSLPSPTSPDDGPFGSEGVPLTPGRSLAVDRNFLPMGLPVWLDAEDPLDPRQRVRRLLIAQDTGGAIRGPVRGDVFWGFGADAAERAGRMRSAGRYWILLPRAAAPRGPSS
jgi:membrane-bound lytic murein transglycosylase A